ncbi:Membrane protein involved in the export of O-antigen and teichoic acid [Fibrobacter sp. UWH5]|uniref:oligosaccharide flippase family protein n=1 Tax=Fibrobacter sp. UWH5 TaxID=1896211 RepID=UPI0009196CBD|nr:oligosaccharide flippase family protein [Fibrobacter sp. UWH5]SHL04791.1 Membrane protein involved in the export of O-antigen and teichoic acid [Fibrobacter sp. UWH5]
MMMSQLKIGALLSYVVLALNNLLGLLYTPYLLRMLGKSEYGLYSIAASIIAYLTVLDLGFGNAIVRYTAKYRAEGKHEEQYKMFGIFFLLYCCIGLVAAGLGCFFAFNTDIFFKEAMTALELERVRVLVILMVMNLAVTFPLSLFTSIVTAYEQFIFSKSLNIVRIILNTLTMVVLLQFGYKAVALAVVASLFNVLTLLANLFYCKFKLKIKMKFGHVDWSFLKEISIYSFWIFLNAIIDRIYWSTGQFVLGAFVGTAAVAVFAVAIQLEHMYMAFSTAITSVFLPKVTAIVSNTANSDDEVSSLFIKTGRIQFCILALILSGFALFGKQFVVLWAGEGYTEAYIITMIFFIPLTVPLIQTLGITILQARNQMRFRSLLYLAISVVSLILQFILTKLHGIVGCAWAIGASLILGHGIIMNVYYQKKQRINILRFWNEILRMARTPLIVAVITYIILKRVCLDSPMLLLIGILCYLSVYLPLFFLFSMNEYEKKLVLNPMRKLVHKIC